MPVTGLTHLEATAIQVRLFCRGTAGLNGWQLERQTRGLELEAEHEKGETPT